MIHVRAMKVPRGNKHGPLYGYYASSGFGPPNTKEQLRRGVLLTTVASVLVFVGSLLTWLVYAEVFGSKVPIMGPLVMSLGILLLVLSIRQFYIVWQHRKNPPKTDKVETAPADDEDMPCDSMLEMETWDGEKPSYLQNSMGTVPYYAQNYKASDVITSDILKPLITTTNTTPSITTTTILMPYSPTATQTQPPYQFPHTPSPSPSQPSPEPSSPPPPPDVQNASSSDGTPKVKSCCDLSSMTRSGGPMARSGSMETSQKPNPRPVIRYSQGQLELLDKEAAAIGRTSPTLASTNATTPSHQSLGDRSISPHERISHKSLSLSIEKTDILETI